jgi:hypothetical protein
MLLTAVAVGSARLPEVGLRRAQQAERLLQAERVDEAIKTLEALAKDYPQEPAVHLRLAQVFDIRGKAGPALHCYRRYIELAGPKAREEARLRVQTLELVASARAEAEAYARARREASRAVATPTPVLKESVEVMRPDGSTAPLTPESLPQVLAEHAGAASAPAPDSTVAPVFPSETMPPIGQSPVTPGAERTRPQASQRPTNPAPPRPAPTREPSPLSPPLTPRPPAEEPLPATPTPPPGAVRSGSAQVRIALNDPKPTSEPTKKSARTGSAAEGRFVSDAASARAAMRREPDPRMARFVEELFREFRHDEAVAAVDLVNRYPMTVISFGAIPVEGGEPVNIILSTGERRSVKIAPGAYDVILTVTATTYPPTTLSDRRFEFEFRAGTRYAANITTELFE